MKPTHKKLIRDCLYSPWRQRLIISKYKRRLSTLYDSLMDEIKHFGLIDLIRRAQNPHRITFENGADIWFVQYSEQNLCGVRGDAIYLLDKGEVTEDEFNNLLVPLLASNLQGSLHGRLIEAGIIEDEGRVFILE